MFFHGSSLDQLVVSTTEHYYILDMADSIKNYSFITHRKQCRAYDFKNDESTTKDATNHNHVNDSFMLVCV